MLNTLDEKLAERVDEWIRNEAERQDIAVTVYPQGIERRGDWLRVPVAVEKEGDAYDRAVWLQSIEDAWEPAQFGGLHATFIPAPPRRRSDTSPYDQVGALMKRQHELLDQIGQNGAGKETVQRFQTVREEWEKTLTEMERLYPLLRNGTA
jgi:hypothetical protein